MGEKNNRGDPRLLEMADSLPCFFYPYSTHINPYYESLPHPHNLQKNIRCIIYEPGGCTYMPPLSLRFYPDVFYPLVPTEDECWTAAAEEAVRKATEGPDSYLARRIVRELHHREA